MLVNPSLSQLVEIRYNPKMRGGAFGATLHGQIGRIVIVGKGKPRNHGVEVNGVLHVIPCGNLNKVNYAD